MNTMNEKFRKYTDEETFSKIVSFPSITAMWEDRAATYADRVAIVDGEEYTVQKEGAFRDFAYEEIVRFPETKARYVKLEVLTTVGVDCERKDFKLSHVAIAELTLWNNA